MPGVPVNPSGWGNDGLVCIHVVAEPTLGVEDIVELEEVLTDNGTDQELVEAGDPGPACVKADGVSCNQQVNQTITSPNTTKRTCKIKFLHS